MMCPRNQSVRDVLKAELAKSVTGFIADLRFPTRPAGIDPNLTWHYQNATFTTVRLSGNVLAS